MRLTTHMRVAVAALAAAVFIGAGCGGDDDEATSASGSSADDNGGLTSPPAAATAFCDAAVAVDTASLGLESGDTTPGEFEQALHAAEEAAPGEIADSVGVMTTEARSLMAEAEAAEGDEGPPPIPSDEFFAASVDVGGYLSDTCDLETVDVTAKNYEFTGIPDTVPAGVTVLNFTNAGTEFHEIALMELPEGEERSVEELLAVPESEQPETTGKAFVLAPPGAATYVTADLDPGRYVALCFVPVGATPEALQSGTALDEEDGHFMHGMITEFAVS